MNYFNKQKTIKTIKMSLKDVVLKGFSLSNCIRKDEVLSNKGPEEKVDNPSTESGINMQYGECRKRFRLNQNRDNSLRWVVF